MFQKIMVAYIMVAYDESPEAAKALQVSIEMARALGAELKVVTVLEPLPSYFSFAPSAEIAVNWRDKQQARYSDLQEKARQEAATAGLHFDTELVHGDEVGTIIECAKKYRADLLILGMRKHTLLMGHTGQDVAERSPCALLGVR
jgi:nucleotide-binding universal stress UspA family protein